MVGGRRRCCFSHRAALLVSANCCVSWRDLLSYGATGHHLYEALGITAVMLERVRARAYLIRWACRCSGRFFVNAPPRKAYDFVRDLENLPRFMQHVKNVSKTDDKRSHWVVKAPAERRWNGTRKSSTTCRASSSPGGRQQPGIAIARVPCVFERTTDAGEQ